MIKTKHLYTFESPYISAASGLAYLDGEFFIVSDDELGLIRLSGDVSSRHEVFPGVLPENIKDRKKEKPDFETIVSLGDDLLILPSFSRSNRVKGALVNSKTLKVTVLDLAKVYERFIVDFPELNIEGAVIINDRIRLFQRGNGSRRENALIDVSLESLYKGEIKNEKIIRVNLGEIHDTPLSFTDATIYNNNILFLAVAEATESTYFDGEYKGSVLGKMNLNGDVVSMREILIPSKPEGIALNQNHLYLVTDDDDRAKPSRLYFAELSSNLF